MHYRDCLNNLLFGRGDAFTESDVLLRWRRRKVLVPGESVLQELLVKVSHTTVWSSVWEGSFLDRCCRSHAVHGGSDYNGSGAAAQQQMCPVLRRPVCWLSSLLSSGARLSFLGMQIFFLSENKINIQ